MAVFTFEKPTTIEVDDYTLCDGCASLIDVNFNTDVRRKLLKQESSLFHVKGTRYFRITTYEGDQEKEIYHVCDSCVSKVINKIFDKFRWITRLNTEVKYGRTATPIDYIPDLQVTVMEPPLRSFLNSEDTE